MYILYKPKDISLIYIITMTDTFTLEKIPDVAPFTIEELSKMTMVNIMDSMNHYRKMSIHYHSDKIELIKKCDNQFNTYMNEKRELKRKYTIEIKELKKKLITKPKRKQIKATKSDLQRWLDTTENMLTQVIETNYSAAEPDEINDMFDVADGRYNKGLRPQFRGISITGYPDKVDIEED